ncbi:hypothetical protein LY76DRAFT_588941 [Colletotrichum caudatum]|nr:hypothetical protein LY76DRAFT_588941 [Colletotrichum caudatum]
MSVGRVQKKTRRHETRRGQLSSNETMGRPTEPALDVRSNMRSDVADNHHGALCMPVAPAFGFPPSAGGNCETRR